MINIFRQSTSSFSIIFRLLLILIVLLLIPSLNVQAKSTVGRYGYASTAVAPNDTYYIPYQWALNDLFPAKLNVPAAWNITTGSSEVVVAVLDTGFDQCHPDLASKNTGTGFNFANGTTNIQDIDGHGTSVSGIIGALSNNSKGVAGMSWGVRIMPVKVLLQESGSDNCIDPNQDWVINGIKWAANNGADIINVSLICQTIDSGQVSKWQQAVDYAYNMGTVIIAGAGNHGQNLDQTFPPVPAGLNHVITVGATDLYDQRCDIATCRFTSGYGHKLDVMGPGSGIATTDVVQLVNNACPISISDDDAYTFGFNGTSAATPFVSGIVALMLSVNPNLNPSSVEYIIQRSVDDLGVPGKDTTFGYGRINAYKAVRRAASCAQAAWPGDANRDCVVDGVDYVMWLNNYGKPTTGGPDFNNDGIVDGIDYVIWLQNYNK